MATFLNFFRSEIQLTISNL